MASRIVLVALGAVFASVLISVYGTGEIEVSIGDGKTATLGHVGCYNDEDAPNRSLRTLYHNHRSEIVWALWPDMTHVISACAREAFEEGFTDMFGVQFYGECWSDVSAASRYSMHGASSHCVNGVGENWANLVYRINGFKDIICEHHTRTIQCPASKTIDVSYANYGRTAPGSEACPSASIQTTNCVSSSATITAACQGQNSCTLQAKNSVYGDPCVGTYKYIEIRYNCV
ncbi:beta-galactosidase 9-like [Nematostella vectensis]|uniref:beta-galactosidase 9-like n=1 Tax=Nematostella vectensis TaxID=45351 RepID=UPI002076DE81|nr:beta-galactosidase 9-like [Nematostella vectensis]XP_048577265.1 beta-galactosidase 9-like [Nematostella vectensis]